MPEQADQTNKAVRPEEVKSDPLHAEDDLYNVVHKTEITICYVKGSDQGTRSYGLYIEDSEGLKKPIGIEITIWPDGSIHTNTEGNPLEGFSNQRLGSSLSAKKKRNLSASKQPDSIPMHNKRPGISLPQAVFFQLPHCSLHYSLRQSSKRFNNL